MQWIKYISPKGGALIGVGLVFLYYALAPIFFGGEKTFFLKVLIICVCAAFCISFGVKFVVFGVSRRKLMTGSSPREGEIFLFHDDVDWDAPSTLQIRLDGEAWELPVSRTEKVLALEDGTIHRARIWRDPETHGPIAVEVDGHSLDTFPDTMRIPLEEFSNLPASQ